jgi:hypothetical protein
MDDLYPLESTWFVPLIAGAIAIFLLYRMAKSLPLQNVILIAAGILLAEGIAEYFLFKFARIELDRPMWRYMLGACLMWLVVVLVSRRLAQFIVRPWRRNRWYGVWVIIFGTATTVCCQFGWPTINIDPDLGILPTDKAAIMAGIRGALTAVLLTALAPWFIRKRASDKNDGLEFAQQPQKEAQ